MKLIKDLNEITFPDNQPDVELVLFAGFILLLFSDQMDKLQLEKSIWSFWHQV